MPHFKELDLYNTMKALYISSTAEEKKGDAWSQISESNEELGRNECSKRKGFVGKAGTCILVCMYVLYVHVCMYVCMYVGR